MNCLAGKTTNKTAPAPLSDNSNNTPSMPWCEEQPAPEASPAEVIPVGQPPEGEDGEPQVTDTDLVKRSLLIFDINSELRQTFLRIIRNRWFDRFITFLILSNCVFLAIDGPTEPYDPDNVKQKAIKNAEYVFLVLFSLEMVIKVVALGFVLGKHTYLRNPWNWLDFIVVIVGYLSFVGVDNLSALRTFRVLRPLRTLTTIPGMKVIVVSMLASIPSLSGVALLMFFMLFVWGIVGVQLWGVGSPGVLEGRCFFPPTRAFNVPLVECNYDFTPTAGIDYACYDKAPTSCNFLTDADGLYVYEQINFPLARATGDIFYPGCGVEEKILPCESSLCGWNSDFTKRVLPSTDETVWAYAGELIVNSDLWPLPRFSKDWEREYDLHGVNVTATIERLGYTKDGEVDEFGTEAGKTIELLLYPNVTITGGWDPDTFCALPGENGNDCETSSNGTVTVQGFCRRWESPQFGNGGFNNIGYAILTVYTSVTLEGWADNLYALNACWGNLWFTVWYFVLLVAFGAFFVMELAMAVIWDQYQAADDARKEKEEEEEEKAAADKADKEAAEKKAEDAEGKTKEVEEPEADVPKETQYWIPDNASVKFIHKIVTGKTFDFLITTFILLNTITLAVEHYEQGKDFVDALSIFNYIFSAVFFLEMVLKLWGLGPREYASDKFNLFDFVIVTFSVIEISFDVAAKVEGKEGQSTGLSALRTFRLMRVFKLARSWKDLQILLTTIIESVMQVANAALLLGVVMFIFTLLGMQLFGGKMKWFYYGSEAEPRAHFDTFWWAFVSVFQVLTGENWNDILYNTMWALGQPESSSSPVLAVVYFLVLNVVGNYMIMNLFLAILLANFEGNDDEEDDDDADEDADEEEADEKEKEEENAAPETPQTPDPPKGEDAPSVVTPREGSTNEYNINENSLMLLAGDNSFRIACFRIIDAPWFDNLVLFLIAVSSILLAADEPYVADCNHKGGSCYHFGQTLLYLDWIISVLFGLEMCLKIVALGFVNHTGAYLRDPWNVLDFLIVIISFLSLALGGGGAMKALRALRALRALKPLRVVRRYPGLRLVVNAIFRALPRVANVSLVAMLFFIIFAIVGVQNFMGRMKHCNDDSITVKSECVGDFELSLDSCGFMPTSEREEACMAGTDRMFPRNWEDVSPWNFDNLGRALLVLYEVASGEMWPDIMYDTINAAGVDEPMVEVDASWPQGTNYVTVSLYYIAVTVVLAFLMLNVFVGVVIDEYNQMKGEEDGSGLMSAKQKEWYQSMKMLSVMNPVVVMTEPAQQWRKFFFHTVESKAFEITIMGLILANTLIMSFRHYPESEAFTDAVELINWAFTILFALEMVLKLIGLGYTQYFSVGWNRFDFTLVILSFVGKIVSISLASLFRIIRVARIVRLVRTSKQVMVLFNTLIYAMPSIINVGVVLLLLYFVMAIIGMNLFSGVRQGELLNSDANFESFGKSFETLFRCSTGESFNGIMYDLMIQEPYCDPDADNCGSEFIPPIFFTFFFTVQAYIFLNLIVAIILDVFGDVNGLANSLVTESHLDSFREIWSRFDTNSNKWIDARHAKTLILETEYPLGLAGINDSKGYAKLAPLTEEQIEEMADAQMAEYDMKAFRHEAQFADRPESVRSDGYVYEISFQDTLQAMANRVSKKYGGRTETLPQKIRSGLSETLEKAKVKQISKKRKQGMVGEPISVAELEKLFAKDRVEEGPPSEEGSSQHL